MDRDKTPGLWYSTKFDLAALRDEELMRQRVAARLDELSAAFSKVQEVAISSNPLTLVQVWALSHITNEKIGITGFNPQEFLDRKLNVTVRVAPSHDLTDFDGCPIATRVVRLEANDNDGGMAVTNGIEIYGLNMHVPNADEASVELEDMPSRLLVVAQSGSTSFSKKPVNGIIPVIAIRNRISGVSKVYATHVSNDKPNEVAVDAIAGIYREEHKLIVPTPDGRFVTIELLHGNSLDEILHEFSAAVEAISGSTPTPTLTDDETTVVKHHLSGRYQ